MASYASEVSEETIGQVTWLVTLVTERIPLWIAAVIVGFVFLLLAKIARKIIESKLADKVEDEHEELQILGGRITYASVLTLGITIALKIAGIDLTTIIAAVAFGIGFALRDLIMNFLAGVMILVSRHFTIGDFIKIGNTIGKIIEIQSRNTILQAIDGTKVIVPNGDLFKKQVISFTSNPFRRIEVIVGVDYRTDLKNATNVCMKALKETKGVLIEPKPMVLVDTFAESSISLKVRAWVESKGAWLKVKSDLVVNIKKEFDAYGITIPWPIRTIAYDKDQEKVEKIMAESALAQKSAKTVKAASESATPAQNKIATQAPVPQEVEAVPLKPLGEK